MIVSVVTTIAAPDGLPDRQPEHVERDVAAEQGVLLAKGAPLKKLSQPSQFDALDRPMINARITDAGRTQTAMGPGSNINGRLSRGFVTRNGRRPAPRAMPKLTNRNTKTATNVAAKTRLCAFSARRKTCS